MARAGPHFSVATDTGPLCLRKLNRKRGLQPSWFRKYRHAYLCLQKRNHEGVIWPTWFRNCRRGHLCLQQRKSTTRPSERPSRKDHGKGHTTLTDHKRPKRPRVWFRGQSRTFEQLPSSSKVPTRGMESAAATNPLLITQLFCGNPEKRCPTCPSCRQPASATTCIANVSSLLACARNSTWTSRQGA